MSRHIVQARDKKYEIVLGWDSPLNTYFAQVYDRSIEDEDDQLILWEAGTPKPIHDLEQLTRIVWKYAVVPQDILTRLYRDANT